LSVGTVYAGLVNGRHGAFAQQRLRLLLVVARQSPEDFKHSIGARAGFTVDVEETTNRFHWISVTNHSVAIVGSFSWAKSIVPARGARIEVRPDDP